jgi:hypothetical protein
LILTQSDQAAEPAGSVTDVILNGLDVPVEELERATGWTVKAEGACRGPICVPLSVTGPTVDARALADRLGMPLVRAEGRDVWALGPSTVSGRALDSATAPDFVLPDLAGRPFRSGSLRGRKVVLVAWASW